ncbi:glycosyltransferase family 4 protein [Niveispirillum sp.]|uniref:glycosyltransferase family 4 protein n=1 Tax=Niveispirillum sp. TaxID=1917217 RepID=UPI001B5DD48C|nr:glycosyltransferase family 4 protein [Niveispirillum sp.]MBP7336475.1 glycosyltransferase family 4 protein [Niveispirillum sp.]
MPERRARRVAFLTPADANVVGAWSGIPYHSLRALRGVYPDIRFFPCPLSHNVRRLLQRAAVPFGLDISREPLVSGLFAAELRGRLRRYDPDLVIGVSAAVQLCRRLVDAPVINVTDAVYAGLVDYYPPTGSGIHPRSRRLGNLQEMAALENSDAVVLSSRWAADSARRYYGVPADRLHVVPFGANLMPAADPVTDRQTDICRLLFVGVDWQRKGGPLVQQVADLLLRRGIKVELHIVGCNPTIDGPHIVRHGFLRKDDPADHQRLMRLFNDSSFFFMPSRREAFGIVYAEASAFGLPSVATATGGVPCAVRHGVNGLLLPEAAGAEAYADAIAEHWGDAERYRLLQRQSVLLSRDTLNWSAWATRVAEIGDSLAGRRIVGIPN